MLAFEWILALLLGAVLLGLFARRVGIPYPSLLALAGTGLALLPIAPRMAIPPELALALFVAPVLLDAAYDAPVRDIRENGWIVGSLVLPAVLISTGAVALVAHSLVEGMPWAAAVVLGAVVAPPDASAAMAVLKQVRPPYRVMVILEGESLLNDATALLIYRLAVGVATRGRIELSQLAPALIYVPLGSVALGWILARSYHAATRRVEDVPSAIILQFVGTFGLWLLAERLRLSAVLTVFVYAIVIARLTARTPARLRVPSFAFWETGVYILNVIAFMLMGLQIRPILEALDPATRVRYAWISAAVVATAILVRILWVLAFATFWRALMFRDKRESAPRLRGALVVGWSGMRGVVTLAAAFALPNDFPHRDLIRFCAFAVVLATLVLQGLTLAPLVRWLRLENDPFVDRETRRGREAVAKAALVAIDGAQGPSADALRSEYRALLDSTRAAPDGSAGTRTEHDELRRRATEAQRNTLADLRERGEIGDDAFHRVEEDLDWGELYAGRLGNPEE